MRVIKLTSDHTRSSFLLTSSNVNSQIAADSFRRKVNKGTPQGGVITPYSSGRCIQRTGDERSYSI